MNFGLHLINIVRTKFNTNLNFTESLWNNFDVRNVPNGPIILSAAQKLETTGFFHSESEKTNCMQELIYDVQNRPLRSPQKSHSQETGNSYGDQRAPKIASLWAYNINAKQQIQQKRV